MGPGAGGGGVLLTIGAAVLVLGVAIFVHELGHFLAAKSVGVGVVRFSIGFGPSTPLRTTRGDTEYVVSWFPLGGYVMMASQEDTDEEAMLEGGRAGRSFPPDQLFERKPLWARIYVITAGVAMNMLFAWVVYVGLAAKYGRVEDPTTTIAAVDMMLLPPAAADLARVAFPARVLRINGDTLRSWNQLREAIITPATERLRLDLAGRAEPVIIELARTQGEQRVNLIRALRPLLEPRIGQVAPGRPAARAGRRTGDLILRAGGDTIVYWDQLVRVIERSAGDTVAVAVRRGDSLLTTALVPEPEEDADPATGLRRTVGKIGVGVLLPLLTVEYGVWGGAVEGTRRALADAGMVVFAVKGLITGGVSPRELGGPIFIGQLSGELARVGLAPFLAFMALFSVNLAVLNLLPIPVLDGGRLVFLLIEGVLRRPLSRRFRMRVSQVGIAVLLAIMALALTNDFLRLFGR